MAQEDESSSEAAHGRGKQVGFIYPDLFSNPHQMQSYNNPTHHDLLQTGMETLGFQQQQINSRGLMRSPIDLWRGGLLGRPDINIHGGGSSTITTASAASSPYYAASATDFTGGASSSQENQLMGVAPDVIDWQQAAAGTRLLVDDSSLRCLLPGGGVGNGDNGSNRGLSLSLSNAMNHQQQMSSPHHWQLMRDDGLVDDGSRFYQMQQPPQQQQQQLRSNRYLGPAQELLTEFCNLGGGQKQKRTQQGKSSQREGEGGGPSPSSLLSLDMVELQRRKARLLAMLEEVDRRYRRYCEQMHSVVASFEAVAGAGAAAAYTTLAWKAMSRHFRCLRDGVLGQIKVTRKAMEEKIPGTSTAPGATRGETPRLKMLDQCIRQQKAFQQGGGGGMVENHQPWRPQRGLPERSVSVLRAWLFEHFLHPYPSDVDKHILSRQTGLSRSQVSNWFINARVRLWKPMVEEMYLEETKEQQQQQEEEEEEHDTSHATTTMASSENYTNINPTQYPHPNNQTSINSTTSSNLNHHQQFGRPFGGIVQDIDFTSYNSSSSNNSVSLTLGLPQHVDGGGAAGGVGGVSLAFPPGAHHQNSMFMSSIMDGDVQGLPYRNFMGAQLLHDLAG